MKILNVCVLLCLFDGWLQASSLKSQLKQQETIGASRAKLMVSEKEKLNNALKELLDLEEVVARDRVHRRMIYRNNIKRLLRQGAHIDGTSSHGKTTLLVTINLNMIQLALAVLNRGANPNIQDEDGETALMAASEFITATVRKNTAIVGELLAKGADPNIQNKTGQTALMEAIIRAYYDNPIDKKVAIVRQLLAEKADPNIQDKEGQTALMHAVGWGCRGNLNINLPIIRILLQAGANVNIQDKVGRSAFDFNYNRGERVVQLLQEYSISSLFDNRNGTAQSFFFNNELNGELILHFS